MRVCSALACVLVFGLAAMLPAHAGGWSADDLWFTGQRAALVVIYDNQPGVIVRDYWLPPWHNHHYFPLTGRLPRIGRRENLAAHTHYRPAQSFYRAWSTSLLPEAPLPPCLATAPRAGCALPPLNK